MVEKDNREQYHVKCFPSLKYKKFKLDCETKTGFNKEQYFVLVVTPICLLSVYSHPHSLKKNDCFLHHDYGYKKKQQQQGGRSLCCCRGKNQFIVVLLTFSSGQCVKYLTICWVQQQRQTLHEQGDLFSCKRKTEIALSSNRSLAYTVTFVAVSSQLFFH
jgi:hypothetical protein